MNYFGIFQGRQLRALELVGEEGLGSTSLAGTGSTWLAGAGSTLLAGAGSTLLAGTGSTWLAGAGSTLLAGAGSTLLDRNWLDLARPELALRSLLGLACTWQAVRRKTGVSLMDLAFGVLQWLIFGLYLGLVWN